MVDSYGLRKSLIELSESEVDFMAVLEAKGSLIYNPTNESFLVKN